MQDIQFSYVMLMPGNSPIKRASRRTRYFFTQSRFAEKVFRMPAPEPETKHVLLISNDGFEISILREAALYSGTLKRMLDPKSKPFSC
jgi:hypothetical protein